MPTNEPNRPTADLIVQGGEERRLGCLSPVLLGKTFAPFPRWAASKPTFSLDYLRKHPAKRRALFDRSWIKNQSRYGSCNGWAIAQALAKARVLRGQPRVDLSGSSIYAQINGNRDNGSTLDDGMDAVQRGRGILPESHSRPDQIYLSQYPSAVWAEAARFKAADGECYTLDSDLEVASAIACDYGVVVAVHVDSRFDQTGVGGVSHGGAGVGNHSVNLDGFEWDDQLGALKYDLPNSWGTSWGDGGRIFVTYARHLKPTRQYHQFFGIRAAIEDPKGDNPPAVN